MTKKYTEEEHTKWLSDSYSALKVQYKLLKDECAEKGRKNAILNDKYLECQRKIKWLEAETPDSLLERIHNLTEKVRVLIEIQGHETTAK